jgi:oligopeptide transport system substrate-binding protein
MLTGCASTTTTDTETPTDDVTVATKELVVATLTDIQSMDNVPATDGTSFIAMQNITSGLTSVNADGTISAENAASWDISEDGAVYTFYLDEAYTWSNGTAVTANDYVYGWTRMVDPESAATYSFIFDTIKLQNIAGVNSGELALEELGVKAIDDYTLEVTLDAPCDFFLSLCAFPSFYPLNEEFVEGLGDQYATSIDTVLSSGPYVLTDWTPGNSFTFTKNEAYPKADEVNLDLLTFKVLKDPQSAMLGFETEDVDVVPLSGDQVDLYSDRPEFANRLTGYLWYLCVNQEAEDPALANMNFRLAMGWAVDRDAIVNIILKDGSIASEGIIPKDLAVSPDGVEYRDDADSYYGLDVEKAQTYLASAFEELAVDSIEIDFVFEDSESSKSVAEFIKSEIEKNLPGVTINLQSQTKKARLALMKSGDYEMGLTRWGPDYGDPQTYLDLFTSWVGDGTNMGRVKSESYDALITEAFQGESSTDSAARWELMKDAEAVLMEEAGALPLYQNGGAMMIKDTVSGIEFHSVSIDSFKHADITE